MAYNIYIYIYAYIYLVFLHGAYSDPSTPLIEAYKNELFDLASHLPSPLSLHNASAALSGPPPSALKSAFVNSGASQGPEGVVGVVITDHYQSYANEYYHSRCVVGLYIYIICLLSPIISLLWGWFDRLRYLRGYSFIISKLIHIHIYIYISI